VPSVKFRAIIVSRLFIAALTAMAMLFVGCSGAREKPPVKQRRVTSAHRGSSHTVVIVLENRELSEVVGAAKSSVFDELAATGALAVDYHAVAHPSLPNYLALIGGSTFGIDEDCTDCQASGANLATQLSAAGLSWRAYMGSMPRPCFGGAESGDYAKRHNPFLYFPSVADNPKLCANDVPEGELSEQLAKGELPAFSWISPNLCDDAHSCDLGDAEDYLRKLIPRLRRELGPRGILAITFDEGSSNASCCGNADGGRVATILIGPEVRRGVRLHGAYSHYSLLATLEDRFGLDRLRNARTAAPMTAAFEQG
jgi:hypothetical protein